MQEHRPIGPTQRTVTVRQIARLLSSGILDALKSRRCSAADSFDISMAMNTFRPTLEIAEVLDSRYDERHKRGEITKATYDAEMLMLFARKVHVSYTPIQVAGLDSEVVGVLVATVDHKELRDAAWFLNGIGQLLDDEQVSDEESGKYNGSVESIDKANEIGAAGEAPTGSVQH